jgi:hypothetical protein
MIEVQDREHFKNVVRFARRRGISDRLFATLRHLGTYANRTGCTYDKQTGRDTKCIIGRDWAPNSFGFCMMRKEGPDKPWEQWFFGGMIYSGPSQPLDGSGPAFTCSISPDDKEGWSVHT